MLPTGGVAPWAQSSVQGSDTPAVRLREAWAEHLVTAPDLE